MDEEVYGGANSFVATPDEPVGRSRHHRPLLRPLRRGDVEAAAAAAAAAGSDGYGGVVHGGVGGAYSGGGSAGVAAAAAAAAAADAGDSVGAAGAGGGVFVGGWVGGFGDISWDAGLGVLGTGDDSGEEDAASRGRRCRTWLARLLPLRRARRGGDGSTGGGDGGVMGGADGDGGGRGRGRRRRRRRLRDWADDASGGGWGMGDADFPLALSYEQLLELEERNVTRGLSEAELRRLPVRVVVCERNKSATFGPSSGVGGRRPTPLAGVVVVAAAVVVATPRTGAPPWWLCQTVLPRAGRSPSLRRPVPHLSGPARVGRWRRQRRQWQRRQRRRR